MSDLREYLKLKYAGDCKCGQCNLVPVDVIEETATEIERLTAERDAALAKLAQYEQAPVVGWVITDGTTTDFARYKDEANEVASSIDAVIPLIARPEASK